MNEADPQDIIQTVYTAAQLVADDLDEAARLVERVFSESDPVTADDALIRLQRAAAGMDRRRQGVLAARLRREKLDRVVQEALAILPAGRRLDVLQAYLHPDTEHPERTVFLYAVRRGMDERGSLPVSIGEVGDALDRTIGASAAPVPPTLRAVVESELGRRRAHAAVAAGTPAASKSARRPALRFVTALLVILAASAIGIWFGRPSTEPGTNLSGPPDLFSILGTSSPTEVVFSGSNASQAEQMLLDRFDIRARVPELDGGRLSTLSVVQAGEESDIPVLQYLTEADVALDLFVIPYVYLENYRFEWGLSTDILDQLATGGVDIAVNGNRARIAWRVRDDIYVVWTSGDATSLRSRFRY